MAQKEPLIKSVHHILHGSDSKLLSFNKNHKPLVTIDSGEEVSFDNTHVGFHRITRHTTDAELVEMGPKTLLDIEGCMGPIYVDGPVYVNGAEPGDILQLEILELQTGDWGGPPSSPVWAYCRTRCPDRTSKPLSCGRIIMPSSSLACTSRVSRSTAPWASRPPRTAIFIPSSPGMTSGATLTAATWARAQ
jgi:hypothetical protein